MDTRGETKLDLMSDGEHVGEWQEDNVNDSKNDRKNEGNRHVSDQGQRVIDFSEFTWVFNQQKYRGHQKHEDVEGGNRRDHGTVLFIILQSADCINYTIVIKPELDL